MISITYRQIFSFGNLEFYGSLENPIKKPSTYKVIVGKKVIEKNVAMRNTYDWNLRIRGYLTGTLNGLTLEQEKTALKALHDATYHAWLDGEHDGNYIIPDGGLVIDPSVNLDNAIKFTISIIQWNQ